MRITEVPEAISFKDKSVGVVSKKTVEIISMGAEHCCSAK